MSKKFIVLFALLITIKILMGEQKVENEDLSKESVYKNVDLHLLQTSMQSIQTAIESISTMYLHNLEPKLMQIFTQTSSLDANIKTLQEKTQNWYILQHHINAWSDHMKAMDKKIDLLKQTQENVFPLEKIVSDFEFKTNHIFEKVDILNEKMHEMLSILYHFKNPHVKNDSQLEKMMKNLSNIENQIKSFERIVNQNVPRDSTKIQGSVESENKEMKQVVQNYKNIMKKLDNILSGLEIVGKSVSNGINDAKDADSDHSLKQIDEKIEDLISSIQSGFDRFEEILYKIQKTIADNHDELKSICTARNTTNSDVLVGKNDRPLKDEFRQPYLSSCHKLEGRKNGVYHFGLFDQPNENGKLFNKRLCEFATTGPAWTVIQRRGDFPTNENFNRSWEDYKNGFGNLESEFWFGNDFIHKLTNEADQELRVELEDFEGNTVWAEYQTFYVAPEDSMYHLEIYGYRGIVPDSLLYHNLQPFSTYDRNNDKTSGVLLPCALTFGSGWWFRGCGESNLNGRYHSDPRSGHYTGILWEHWLGNYSLKSSKMLIRNRSQNTTRWEDETNANKTILFDEDP